jgi:hypothetical protein
MPRKAAKSRRTPPKPRGLYTPEPVRGRVLVRHMNGQSKREIARVEGIDRETVGRILSQQEVVNQIAQNQARLLSLVPKAIKVCEEALDSDDLRLATATATKILEGMQVLGGIEQVYEFAKKASPEADRERQRILILGEMMDMALHKQQRFSVTLPPGLDKVEEDVKKRMEQPGSSHS